MSGTLFLLSAEKYHASMKEVEVNDAPIHRMSFFHEG
jgi:hypothetical protein